MKVPSNEQIIKSCNSLIKRAAGQYNIHPGAVHEIILGLVQFSRADDLGIDIESKLPEKTLRGNDGLHGRIISFFTSVFVELERRFGYKIKRTKINEDAFNYRAVEPEYIGEFISIINLKLGIPN
ncbi:MAG: hypothetical protein QXN55_00680 [Candidatus Nitrosotenuis sp.]